MAGLTHIGRAVPDSLRVKAAEAARIADGCRWNKRACEAMKEIHGWGSLRDNPIPNAGLVKRWIAETRPEPELVDAMRRIWRVLSANDPLKGGV